MNSFKKHCLLLALGITTAMVGMDHIGSLSEQSNNTNGTVPNHDHGLTDKKVQEEEDFIIKVIQTVFIYPTDKEFIRYSLKDLKLLVHTNLSIRQAFLKDSKISIGTVDSFFNQVLTPFFRDLALRNNIELLLRQMSPIIATYLDGSFNNNNHLGNIIKSCYSLKQINDMVRSHDPVQFRSLLRNDSKNPFTKAAIAGLINDYDHLFDPLTYSSDSDEDSAFESVSDTSSDVSSDYELIGSDSETIGGDVGKIGSLFSDEKDEKSDNACLPHDSPSYYLRNLFTVHESDTPGTIDSNTPYESSHDSCSSRSSPAYCLENLFAENGSNTSNQCHGVHE